MGKLLPLKTGLNGIIFNPAAGPHVRSTLKAYQDYGLLDAFFTTLYFSDNDFLVRLLTKTAPTIAHQLKRRQIKGIDQKKIRTKSFFEIARILADKSSNLFLKDWIWERGELEFDRWVAKKLNEKTNWVHGYEHSSLATFIAAKEKSIPSFYEQPSQHFAFFDALAKEQLRKYPELKGAETKLLIDADSVRRNKRRAAELDLCDYIICNSSFTAKTLTDANVNKKKIIRIPLPFPAIDHLPAEKKEQLIFIYAGNQSLRKGTHLLYKAWQRCNFQVGEAELWMVGANQLPLSIRNGLGDDVKFLPNLPFDELSKLYKKAAVLILPTLADGFGMVITEAMAQGLPVITTQNCAGPDIITHLKNGFLTEAGNIEMLAERMLWCERNRAVLAKIGENAMLKAATYNQQDYSKLLINEITTRVEKR